jgi:DNA-binding transcriptional MocR family regulator
MAKAKALPADLSLVEKLAEIYAKKRAVLKGIVAKIQLEIAQANSRHSVALRKAATETRDARAALEEAIEAAKPEFVKPKTRTFHGIVVGFRKLIGKLTWSDADAVVKLIKKHFADKTDLLIKTTETPAKETLEKLPAEDLKKLGVSVGQDSDVVVIKAGTDPIDKLVEALLKDKADEDEE